MVSARVSKLLVLFIAVLAAATLSTGTAWATPGACETLPGGVIELESTGGAVGPTGYATLGAALADVNNGSYTGVDHDRRLRRHDGGRERGSERERHRRLVVHGRHDLSRGRRAAHDLRRHRGGPDRPERRGRRRHRRPQHRRERADDRQHEHRRRRRRRSASSRTPPATRSGTARSRAPRPARPRARSCSRPGTTTGNLNDTITANTITSSGANLPVNAIYSAGTSTSVANTGIAITNNNIQDYFSATLASNGILVASNSAAWTITGNKLFQTATRTATTANTHRAINIVTASGGGYTVSNNTIGYADAAGAGTTTYAGAVASLYRAIEMTVAASPASDIQGNTVTAISFSTTSASAIAPGVFAGISVLGGSVNVGTTTGNTIGSATTTGAITVTSTVTAQPDRRHLRRRAGARRSTFRTTTWAASPRAAQPPRSASSSAASTTAGAGANVTLSGNTIGSTTAANSIQVGINRHDDRGDDLRRHLEHRDGHDLDHEQHDSERLGLRLRAPPSSRGSAIPAAPARSTITGNSVIAGTSRGTPPHEPGHRQRRPPPRPSTSTTT